ncbi:MAG TPA: hypothetical protein VLA88_05295 [Candidatus Saccharimonadales bacterium]|nr:hypothetical protein [Candidatus Saccharimonadales bacterium]
MEETEATGRELVVRQSLPAKVQRMGGAIVTVLTEQYPDMQPETIMDIGTLVGMYPDLNTEGSVDVLAWTATFHKLEIRPWFADLVDRYGLDRLYLAIECMYDLGIVQDRSTPGLDEELEMTSASEERGSLEEVLDMLDQFDRVGHAPENTEEFAEQVRELGGWETAKHLGDGAVGDVLSGTREIEDVVSDPVMDRGYAEQEPIHRSKLTKLTSVEEDGSRLDDNN